MLTALQGHFAEISSKVRKLRRERERSVSTAVSTAGQTMTVLESVKLWDGRMEGRTDRRRE